MITEYVENGVPMVRFYDMLSDSIVNMTKEKYDGLQKTPVIPGEDSPFRYRGEDES